MLVMNKKTQNTGYTSGISMIETLVYVTLVALVLTFTVNVLLTVSKTFANLRLSKGMNVSANIILDRIIRETRAAETVVTEESIFDVHPGKLTVSRTLPDNSTTKTTFFIEDNTIKLWRDGSTIGPLSVNNVTVDSFIISHATSTHSDTVNIDINIVGSLGTIVRTGNYHTVAVTRN